MNNGPYIRHSRLGVILFAVGLAGAFVTAMASDSGALTIWQVWVLGVIESLAMGTGAVITE